MSIKALDKLGLAIVDAGYDWTPEMRKAYEDGVRQSRWVGLDEDRVAYLADKYAPPIDSAFTKDDDYWRFYKEIEAELKEKNT